MVSVAGKRRPVFHFVIVAAGLLLMTTVLELVQITSAFSVVTRQHRILSPLNPTVPIYHSSCTTMTHSITSTDEKVKNKDINLLRRNAWPKNRDPTGMAADYPQAKSRFLLTIVATLLTWRATSYGVCSSVFASSATTLAASLWNPGLGQAAFIGSFAGMSSIGVLVTWRHALLAGGLTAGLFEYVIHRANVWRGLGGRLGFLAFCAVNLVAATSRISPLPGAFSGSGGPILGLDFPSFVAGFKTGPLRSGAVFGALGSVLTICLREAAEDESADMSDPVRASAVVGVMAALLVGIDKSFGDFAALLTFGGSFAGMSLPLRLCKGVIPGRKKRSQPRNATIVACFAIAGAIGGIIHAGSVGVDWWSTPAGWGGKAGASAFGGVLIFRAIEKFVYMIRMQLGKKDEDKALPEIY